MEDVFGLLGQLLDGKYLVQSVEGEGGFGVVYRAQHRALAVPVALKVLKIPDDFTERARGEFAQGFLAEAQTVARLQHPAVVRAIDFGVSPMPAGQTAPWTVFEWVEGQTLDVWCEARGRRPCAPREALELLRPVFEALAIAHAQGVVHRDIKPPNIMVLTPPAAAGLQGHQPATRVLDFGIAKAMQRDEDKAPSGATHTHSALVAFSLPYAAPEQATSMRTGPWTDVHALALVFVELVAGRRAYQGDDKMTLCAAVLSPTRPTPRTLGVDVGAVEPVLERALALQPAQRFADAAALLAALDSAVAPPAGATPPSIAATQLAPAPAAAPTARAHDSPPRIAPTGRRTSAWLATVAVVMVAGVVGVVLVVLRGRAPPPVAARHAAAPDAGPSAAATAAATPTPCPEGMRAFDGGELALEGRTALHVGRFCIDREPVSVAAYAACARATGDDRCGPADSVHGLRLSPRSRARRSRACAVLGAAPGGGPIDCAAWADAARYCARGGNRLPTPAEWEFAMRGGPLARPEASIDRYRSRHDELAADAVQGQMEVTSEAWRGLTPEGWEAGASARYHPFAGGPGAPFGLGRSAGALEAVLDVPRAIWEWTSAEGVAPREAEVALLADWVEAWAGGVSVGGRVVARLTLPTSVRNVGLGFRCARSRGEP